MSASAFGGTIHRIAVSVSVSVSAPEPGGAARDDPAVAGGLFPGAVCAGA